MQPGQYYRLVVIFKNTGPTAWIPEYYKLQVKLFDVNSNSVWSKEEYRLEKSIEPGSIFTYEVKISAPKIEGIYAFKAQMLKNDYPFGEIYRPKFIAIFY